MPAETTLLVADDDQELLAVTSFALRHAGFGVVTAENGTVALDLLQRERFGLALLDINMPGADGFALCAEIRHRSRMPVIMLSARDGEADIVRALETGADDYIKKPFSPRMLIARIEALLRRSATADVKFVETDNATLDLESRSLDVDGRSIALTPLETSGVWAAHQSCRLPLHFQKRPVVSSERSSMTFTIPAALSAGSI